MITLVLSQYSDFRRTSLQSVIVSRLSDPFVVQKNTDKTEGVITKNGEYQKYINSAVNPRRVVINEVLGKNEP